jgi:hypothetical protein
MSQPPQPNTDFFEGLFNATLCSAPIWALIIYLLA